MKKEFVCCVCPISCHITVSEEGGEIRVEGNECSRGREHGIQEYSDPLRMLTTTVAVKSSTLPRLPVISIKEIPRAKIGECLDVLYTMEVSAPLRCGDVIVKNIGETGVDIIASRTIY